jgi:STE24 endopeptidase
VAAAAVTLYLQPVVIAPLFNRFEPLPPGELRSEVLRLADRAGVDVGEVYRVDASRRTTAINAYVGGLGQTKRVVLYDNLIEDYPREQVRSVVAHELGHVKHRDVPRGLLWIAIVAPAGTFLVQRLAERFAGGGLDGPERPGPAALPAVVLSFSLVAFGLTCAGNVLSRQVEARADAYALELTGEPRAFVALTRSLAIRNLGDPDPPPAFHALFGTHPTTIDRIGYGVTVAEEQRTER